MARKRRSQKPQWNPSLLVFPQSGSVRLVEEQLPRDQESLEATIGERFRRSLEHFHSTLLTSQSEKAEPADLSYRNSRGARIDVQVVEVVDLKLRAVSRIRSAYTSAIQASLGARLRKFGGCRLTVVDSGDPPCLPVLFSAEGQLCLQQLSSHFASIADRVSSLKVGEMRTRRTIVGSDARTVGILVERLTPQTDAGPIGFRWSGGGSSYRTDISHGLLTAAIRTKIAKQYAKPVSAKFWLLAYSVDLLIHKSDPDLAESRRALSLTHHPFDSVWYLFPYANQPIGSLLHIWSLTDGE